VTEVLDSFGRLVFKQVEQKGLTASGQKKVTLIPRCPAKSAHTRQSGPESGLGFQVKVLLNFFSRSLLARQRTTKKVWVVARWTRLVCSIRSDGHDKQTPLRAGSRDCGGWRGSDRCAAPTVRGRQNPQPLTSTPKPGTRNPKPETLNQVTEILDSFGRLVFERRQKKLTASGQKKVTPIPRFYNVQESKPISILVSEVPLSIHCWGGGKTAREAHGFSSQGPLPREHDLVKQAKVQCVFDGDATKYSHTVKANSPQPPLPPKTPRTTAIPWAKRRLLKGQFSIRVHGHDTRSSDRVLHERILPRPKLHFETRALSCKPSRTPRHIFKVTL
jgi:hypothetical protein